MNKRKLFDFKNFFIGLFIKRTKPKIWCCVYPDNCRTWNMTYEEARVYRTNHPDTVIKIVDLIIENE